MTVSEVLCRVGKGAWRLSDPGRIPGPYRLVPVALVLWGLSLGLSVGSSLGLPVDSPRFGSRTLFLVSGIILAVGIPLSGASILVYRRRHQDSRGSELRAVVRAAMVVALTLVAAVGTTNIALTRARVEADPLLSFIRATPSVNEAEPPLLGYRAAPARAPTVSMRIRATERARPIVAAPDGTERMVLAARTVSVRGAPSDVPVLLVGARLDALRIGDTADVDGSVRESAPGTGEVAWVSVRAVPRVETPAPGGPARMVQRAVDGLREGLVQAASVLPGNAGTLLPGLAIGETRTLPVDLDQAMRDTGLTHLVAVSGANCAVVIAVCAGLAALLGAGRRIRIVAGTIGLGGFVLLVGPDPSVLRAAVMAVVALAFLLYGRPGAGIPLLNIAVIVLLLVDPGLAGDYGFLLSVAATAGLLMLSTPIATVLKRWLPGWLAYALAIPTAAQLACGPILILLRPEMTMTAIPANLLAEPAAPLATLMGVIACIAQALWPPLGFVAVWIAWLPTAWIIAVARFFAAVPGGIVSWLPGPVGALGLCALTVVVLGCIFHRARRLRWGVAVLVTGTLLTGAAVVPPILARAGTPQNWIIAACDVGQGDAVLVRSGGSVALIDSGREPAALTRCLDRLGIDRINLFVLTHYDADHSGGIGALDGRIDTALIATPHSEQDKRVRAQLPSGARQARDGDRGTLGGLNWRVFWPPPAQDGLSANGSAVVWGFVGEGTRALFLADLGGDTQALLIPSLAASGYAHATDVVKVAHHGSADQDPELYRVLHPRIGIISVGARNTYGHPRAQTLDFLRALGVRTMRTDLNGTVYIVRTGRGLEVRTER